VILFDIAKLEKDVEEFHNKTLAEGFWNNQDSSSSVLSKLKNCQRKLERYNKIRSELDNLIDLNNLLLEDLDEEMAKDVLKSSKHIEEEITSLELETLLNGKYDANNAILTIHPGAGRNRISGLGRNAIQNVWEMGKFKWIYIN